MKARKADAEPEKQEPFKLRKFPPISAATRRRLERAGQMTFPEIGSATPKGKPDADAS